MPDVAPTGILRALVMIALVCALPSHLASPAYAWLTPVEPGPSSGWDTGRAAARAPNGDLFVAGTLALAAGNGGVSIARLAATDGAVLWKETYRPIDGIFGRADAVAVDAAGDVVGAGWISRSGNSFYEIAVVKRDGVTGAELWHYKPNALCGNYATGNVTELARAVAIDAAGDVFITGNFQTCNASRGTDLVAVKLRGTDGQVLWRTEINGTQFSPPGDFGYAIAIDPSGHAVVGGLINSASIFSDSIVLELDGATGAERWRLVGNVPPLASGGLVRALAVDAAGDVLATGLIGYSANQRLPVIKVHGDTGALVWHATAGGAGECCNTGTLGGYAIAVASDGDPIVTGFNNSGAVVRRIDGTTGATADWSHTDGIIGGFFGMVLDGSGDVLLVGRRSVGSTAIVIARKLAGATGALAWSTDVHSSTSFEEGNAVASDGAGNVYVVGLMSLYFDRTEMVGAKLAGSDGTHVGCGDGTVGAGEACEDGNFIDGDCCNSFCQLEPSGSICRASTGECDPAETCDGATTICPSNAFSPSGTACASDASPCTADHCNGAGACTHPAGNAGATCRVAVDPICDVAETCDGVSTSCPPNGFAPTGTPCADEGSVCTVDACNGGVCQHTPGNAGLECRAAAGVCDVAESCTGSSGTCPFDAQVPSGTSCRASTGVCDPAETCNGSAATCPGDVLLPSGSLCRASAGICDAAETCDGTAVACPADARVASGTPCRGSSGICDPAEQCDGVATDCPADAVEPIGTPCDDGDMCTPTDECNATGQCIGSGDTCNDCCNAHPGGSCSDVSCTECVASSDDPSCLTTWDDLCVEAAETYCSYACPCAPAPVCPGNSNDPEDCTNLVVCYKAKATKGSVKFVPIDALPIVPDFTQPAVSKPSELCIAAAPNGGSVPSPGVHQERYKAKPSSSVIARYAHMQDRFGTFEAGLIKPESVLIPTALGTGTAPPAPNPAAGDSHLCYKAKPYDKFPKGVQIITSDGFSNDRLYDVKKVARVCLPVDTGDRVANFGSHLVCYQVKIAKGEPKHATVAGQIHTANEFGTERLDISTQTQICVPAKKLNP
jgi:cysteine-rich repeat protein